MRCSAAIAAVAALAIAGAVTGCGGGDADRPAAAPATPEKPAAGATSDDAARSATVGMEGVSFVPAAVSITAGGTVTFDNTSTISHNVTFDDEASDTLDPGADYERSFAKGGTFAFVCTFHAGMKGTVTVR